MISKFKHIIKDTSYNERIIKLVINLSKERIHFVNVYWHLMPIKVKKKQRLSVTPYKKKIDKISDGERTLIMEDLNARVKNIIVNGAMQKFNEP